MRVKPPSLDALSDIAESYGFDLTEEDLESFQGLISPIMASYERLDQLPEPALPVKYARTPGHRPSPEDNPLNAWYWRSEIKGADSGPLAGKTVAIKDNVSVAGVPMMNGTAVLEGYVPTPTPPSSPASSMPEALSSVRPSAKACASPAAATPPTPALSAIPMTRPVAPADHPVAAPPL